MPRNWAGGRKTRAWTSDGDTSLLRADNAVERSSRISEGFKISESEDEEGFALGEAFGWEAETVRHTVDVRRHRVAIRFVDALQAESTLRLVKQ